MDIETFLKTYSPAAGNYSVRGISSRSHPDASLLNFSIPRFDEGFHHVPAVSIPPPPTEAPDRRRIANALIRAGVRHPGIRDVDLATLHRVGLETGYLELFADINSLTTGLLWQLLHSLRPRVARVIVSSVSIDILHEHYNRNVSSGRGTALQRNEMIRGLRELDRIRQAVPVQVYQLRPGESRYVSRTKTPDPEASEDGSYVSEDRQMMAAYWAYRGEGLPRLPVVVVTSDFSLAHVCHAERAEYFFARTVEELLSRGVGWVPETLWFDPYGLALRHCTIHSILWELSLVYHHLRIVPVPPSGDGGGIDLEYDPKTHSPGLQAELSMKASPQGQVPLDGGSEVAEVEPSGTPPGVRRRKIDISLPSLVAAFPCPKCKPAPLKNMGLTSEDSLRQVSAIADSTRIFTIEEDTLIEGDEFSAFLQALRDRDHLRLNELFRRLPSYDAVLVAAEAGGHFQNSRIAGALTGWAVILGAGYKTKKDGVLFGLAPVTPEVFLTHLHEAHETVAGHQPAAPLPQLLDVVCRRLRMSPTRFEALLEHCMSKKLLPGFQLQMASQQVDIPPHPVLVAPTPGSRTSYLRTMEPGRGIHLQSRLRSSLVRPQEATA